MEIIRLTTDAGLVGYGETLPHYTWGKVPESAIERVKGRNPTDFLGDDSLGAGLGIWRSMMSSVKHLMRHFIVFLTCPRCGSGVRLAWWNTEDGPEDLAGEAQYIGRRLPLPQV